MHSRRPQKKQKGSAQLIWAQKKAPSMEISARNHQPERREGDRESLLHIYIYISYVYIYIYGWLSIFLLPGTADVDKIMVPPYDEKENEGLERWLWQVQKCSTILVPDAKTSQNTLAPSF